jgi:hypothetical protein
MSRPLHSPWFDLPNNIWRWVQITKLPTVHLTSFSRHFIPLSVDEVPIGLNQNKLNQHNVIQCNVINLT